MCRVVLASTNNKIPLRPTALNLHEANTLATLKKSDKLKETWILQKDLHRGNDIATIWNPMSHP